MSTNTNEKAKEYREQLREMRKTVQSWTSEGSLDQSARDNFSAASASLDAAEKALERAGEQQAKRQNA